MSLYRPKFLLEWLEIRRQGGFKLLLKKKGWKVILAIVVYYLTVSYTHLRAHETPAHLVCRGLG